MDQNIKFPDIGPETPINDLVKMYRETRDFLAAERKQFEALERQLDDLLLRIGMCLREKGDELGVDSFKTEFGTAYRAVTVKYRVGNWDTVLQYIKDTNNFQMLEKRVGKNACKEIHQATGAVPPGLEFSQEVTFNVRAS